MMQGPMNITRLLYSKFFATCYSLIFLPINVMCRDRQEDRETKWQTDRRVDTYYILKSNAPLTAYPPVSPPVTHNVHVPFFFLYSVTCFIVSYTAVILECTHIKYRKL